MIVEEFYLTSDGGLERLQQLTDLSLDEIEKAVKGRFRENHSRWPNKLKGFVKIYIDGKIVIQHHFTKKKLWSSED